MTAGITSLLLSAALAACGGGGAAGDGGGSVDTSAAADGGRGRGGPTAVEAAVAERDTLIESVRAVGSLEADARVEMKPEIDGPVTEILFTEGEAVGKGEVLLRLDQNKLEAELQAARASLARARAREENLEKRLERHDSLLADGAISEQTYDDVQTEYNSASAAVREARANVELARQRLEDATIRSPVEGRAGARTFDLGDYVSVGETLFTVVDDDPMEIRFSVPERYLGRLHRGSPVELRVRSMPERTFTGRVDYVSPYVDAGNRTVELKARVPNPASELRAGQFANVTLQLDRRVGVLVPEAAIVSGQRANALYLVRGGTARRRTVELGQREPGRVEILSGVSPGDTVVVAGHQKIQDGSPVSVVRGPATLPRGVGGEEQEADGESASSSR